MRYRNNARLKTPRNLGITKNIPKCHSYKRSLNIFNIGMSERIQSTIHKANQKKKKKKIPTENSQNRLIHGYCKMKLQLYAFKHIYTDI